MVNFGLSGLVTWCTCQLEEGPPAAVEMRLLVESAPFGRARDHTKALHLLGSSATQPYLQSSCDSECGGLREQIFLQV